MASNWLMEGRTSRGEPMSRAGQDSLEDRLTRAVEAYHDAALLYAAVTLGLPETMGGTAWRAEDLARALRLSAPHLARFLRGLCIIGLCEEMADGRFALTAFGRSLGPESRLAQKARIVIEQYWPPWAHLASTLRSGAPAFAELFGASVFDWRRDHPVQGALFASYLAKQTEAETEAILAALDAGDTGGAIVLTGAIVDSAAIPSGGTLYVLHGVLQNHDDEAARAILVRCRAAMREGGRLVVAERLLPERAADDPAAIMLDLHMMAITGGRARSLAELEALLAAAGLAPSGVRRTGSGLAAIEAGPLS
jgi:hypothetical protein